MALFRFYTGKENNYVQLGWGEMSYLKSPISITVTQKDAHGDYNHTEEFPSFYYDKTQSKTGYTFKSTLGELTIKWVTKFWIISEIQVLLDGVKLNGGEIINIDGMASGKYV